MKKVINNKLYDTETAKYIATWSNNLFPSDFGFVNETLYKKKTGEYFLLGEGGARTRYAKRIESNTWTSGKEIMPLNYEAATDWAQKNLSGEEYQSIFGVVEDDTRVLGFQLPEADAEKLQRIAAERKTSMSALLRDFISSL